ncbi:MAG: NFACT family protein [Nitrospira sp.]|nr:NFACT family protein [Nitrospira sp.]
MTLHKTEIEQVVAEIVPALRGGWIQKVEQPADSTIIFHVRVPGRTHRLLISCRPETTRLHLTRHSLPNPPTPPAFCRFLRAHVQGARVDDIRQIPNDRIVEIACTSRHGVRTVVCELTGKQADILVIDADRRVLHGLFNRRNLVGHPYVHPAPRQNEDLDTKQIRFIGGGNGSISCTIDDYYSEKESTLTRAHAEAIRRRALQQAVKKERRRIDAWRDDLARAAGYRDYARYGELIKANIGAIKKGADMVTVTDYFDEHLREITIPLDPMKSPQDNMVEYFKKHRKYLAAERELNPRIEQAMRKVVQYQDELQAIEAGTWTPPPPPTPRAVSTGQARHLLSPRSGTKRSDPFRRFLSFDGLPIFVGRNARENDELTFGVARSEDLWFHARGAPGSHVVVRLEKGADPPPETVLDAAALALLYSDLKKSGKGEVIYTRRKWVKKAKGRAPGAVIVSQERSLSVRLDWKRLERLKTRSPAEER